jgi:hypothetical protein
MSTQILNPDAIKNITGGEQNGNGHANGGSAYANMLAGATAPARAVYMRAIPKKYLPLAGDLAGFGIVKITPEEELAANARAQGDPGALAHELVKESLRVLRTAKGDMQVKSYDGSVDRAWSSMDPVIRSLVASAYNREHHADRGDLDAFLDAVEVVV